MREFRTKLEKMENLGLTISVVVDDEDMLELSVHAANTSYSGRVWCYVAKDEPGRLAQYLERFPLDVSETREYVLGDPCREGLSRAKVRLACVDGLGHIDVDVTLRSDARVEFVGEVALRFRTVPVALDSFVSQLRSLSGIAGAGAHLELAH